jgi:hypothetical protein
LPWEIHGPLKVSPDGHSLQHADGTPFFWLGDTAWALHQNLSREDVVRYLDDATAAGFNVIQLMSVNAWALDNWKNYYGDSPYLDDTASKLNPPFWQHLSWVIDQAAARGLFVLLVYGSPGRTDDHGAVTRTPAEAYAYGNALGSLYRDKPNLIWSGGIDVNPDDAKRVSPMGMPGWHAMAEGVADGVNSVVKFDGPADWTSTLASRRQSGRAGGRSSGQQWRQCRAALAELARLHQDAREIDRRRRSRSPGDESLPPDQHLPRTGPQDSLGFGSRAVRQRPRRQRLARPSPPQRI